MSESMKELAGKLEAALAASISEDTLAGLKKQINDLLYAVETDLDYRIKDEIAPNLVSFVVEMAQNSIKAILEGDESEFRRYIGCQRNAYTGRSDSSYWPRKDDEASWHPVIHGTLFEQGVVALRKQLVAAHRDLIADQRILDLEDQVKSLVAQNNKLEARIEKMREAA